MEINHLKSLAWSVVYIFIMTTVKDMSSTASLPYQQFSDETNPGSFSTYSPKETNKPGFGQLQSGQKIDHLDKTDLRNLWRIPEFIEMNSVDTGDGIDSKKWAGLTAWGKRSPELNDESSNLLSDEDDESIDKRKWTQFKSWGKRDEDDESIDKRKWTQFKSWGKRDEDDESIDKRKWTQFKSWGKRDENDESIDKRNWAQFKAWGKRDEDKSLLDVADKRWKGMSMWGKRDGGLNKKWKSVSAWGKRMDDTDLQKWNEMSDLEKRQKELEKHWKIPAWGKRELASSTRKWKTLGAWGKRDTANNNKWKGVPARYKRNGNTVDNLWEDELGNGEDSMEDLVKRWKGMNMWGKRQFDPAEFEKWNNEGIWGKRSFKHIRNWHDMDVWAKRPSWSKTGFTSWGKRSVENIPSLVEHHHTRRELADFQEHGSQKTKLNMLGHGLAATQG